ncbi:high affinity copper transporter [Penicillium malachiteum]|nr:high affinity copper transporter [Penicillium malachiteum]
MSSSSDSSACQISMLFNWYTIDACFLSSGWQIKNRGMFAVTCIGVILLVILVEAFRRLGKEYDLFLTRQYQCQASMLGAKNQAHGGNIFRVTPLQQLVRAVIHALTFGGAYIIMLLAMYFNVYLIICIFIGAGLGKFLCDWMVVPLNLEDAQMVEVKGVEETTICCG